MTRTEMTADQARQRLERLCVRAEYCIADMRGKLRLWGLQPDEREKIVEYLVDKRFVDEERYALAYAHDKLLLTRWVPAKVEAMLRAKGIAPAVITKAVEEAVPQETLDENLRSYLRSKARCMAYSDGYEGHMRLFKAAMARGFEPERIRRILNEKEE